jgi:hypothetical protein
VAAVAAVAAEAQIKNSTLSKNDMADELNFQIPKEGFDSYLYGIIPDDQAVSAGAFSYSMQQIRNIDKIDIIDFAKVAYSIESTVDLPLTNGTDVPTNATASTDAKIKTALGSGVYGTFTHSNFFGAMSGLPYPWKYIYDQIKLLETQNLYTIYQNLYLITSWEQAAATFDGTNFIYTNRGGGYGRETGAPTVTVGGNPAIAVIGTDPDNLDTYGKLVSITYTGPSGIVVIDAPPGIDPSVNNAGYNAIVQGYIDGANAEIQSISSTSTTNFQQCQLLNQYWNITGTALKHEQRARYIAISPVPVPIDTRLSDYPTSMYNFVDSVPSYATQTLPHMAAQTLEHISDVDTMGGQSLIAMMRQERNQERLNTVGIALDNNLPSNLDDTSTLELMTNGTLCNAVEGIESPNGCIYTLPAYPENTEPYSYYDCIEDTVRLITDTAEGSITPILDGTPCPIVNPIVPVGPGPSLDPGLFQDEFGAVPNFSVDIPLPVELDTKYTATTLAPSTYDVNTAIDKVIECNCDCWIN